MEKIKRFCVYFCAVVLIIVDQIVKVAVVTNIKDDAVTIIKGILRFSYCENEGVAFSLGNGHVPVFIVLNLLMICGLVVFYERNKKNFNLVNKIFFTMVIAGG
ncbi:MAG: signal peptidase II, partial [Clostridia bacterium]|nr:signal peptidase II [Clostridia bacterium]